MACASSSDLSAIQWSLLIKLYFYNKRGGGLSEPLLGLNHKLQIIVLDNCDL